MNQRALSALAALALVGACGGEGAAESTFVTGASTTAPSSTTTPATTLAETTTTTTEPPTTTTVPPAVPVVGWGGEGIRAASVAIDADMGGITDELREMAEGALGTVGVATTDTATAVLGFDLVASARSADYGEAGTCFTGARLTGEAALSAPDQPVTAIEVDGDIPVAWIVFGSSCGRTAEEAPFGRAFDGPLLDAMVEFFGVGSVPYLTEVLEKPFAGHSDHELRIRQEAIVAFRLMDPDTIPLDQQYLFAAAVVDSAEAAIVSRDDAVPTFLEAARRALIPYTVEDFGFEDARAFAAWRSRLAEWYADQ